MTNVEPLRLAVIGLGRAFSLMLPTFLADRRIRLVAACDPRIEARRTFEQDFGTPTYDSVEELVKNSDIEVVYVASPHQYHAHHTVLAASHRRHVLVEKPMALSVSECRQMIRACESARVKLIVGHCHSFDTPYLKTREMIDSGEFGAVRFIQAVNYTDFLYRPRRPEELDTQQGGGVMFSQASHHVDIVRLLSGSDVVSVRSALGAWDIRRMSDGAYSMLLWFENGAFASLTYNGYGHFDTDEWCNDFNEMGQPRASDNYGQRRRLLNRIRSPEEEAELKAAATYGGSAYTRPSSFTQTHAYQHFGVFLVSCDYADIRPLPNAINIYGDDSRTIVPLESPVLPRSEVIDELFASVRDGADPLHDGRWAAKTLEVCLAALYSARNNQDASIPQFGHC